MANINDVMDSFLTRPVSELQTLFKEQSDGWLDQFFQAVIETTKDSYKKTDWANRVLEVIPPTACRYITHLFLRRLGIRPEINLITCSIENLFNDLEKNLRTKGDITSILEQIPHDHHRHGVGTGASVFYVVMSSGNIEQIGQLIDVYLPKIGLEKLQTYLQHAPVYFLWNKSAESIKYLINLYKQKGMDPVSFILPSFLKLFNPRFVEICLPEVPKERLLAFVRESGAQYLFNKYPNMELYIHAFDKAGIPRSEFFYDKNAILELFRDSPLELAALVKLMDEETKCSLLLSANFTNKGCAQLVQKEITQLEKRPEILAKRVMTKTADELRTLLSVQSDTWMLEFLTAVATGTKDLTTPKLVITALPLETCLQLVHIFYEKLELTMEQKREVTACNPGIQERQANNLPECHIEEDLIMLKAAIENQCSSHIIPLLEKVPLYHRTYHEDVFDIIMRKSNNTKLVARFFDIHLAKIGPQKLNEFLHEKEWINWTQLDNAKWLIDTYSEKGLNLVSFMFEGEPEPTFVPISLLEDPTFAYLPRIRPDRLIVYVKCFGHTIFSNLFKKKPDALNIFEAFQNAGVPLSVFLSCKNTKGVPLFEKIDEDIAFKPHIQDEIARLKTARTKAMTQKDLNTLEKELDEELLSYN